MPAKDANYTRNRIIKKAKSELSTRISKGYRDIDLKLVEEFVDILLKEMNIK